MYLFPMVNLGIFILIFFEEELDEVCEAGHAMSLEVRSTEQPLSFVHDTDTIRESAAEV